MILNRSSKCPMLKIGLQQKILTCRRRVEQYFAALFRPAGRMLNTSRPELFLL